MLGTLHPLKPKPSDLSSPEAIADFLQRASTTGRTPDEDQSGSQTLSEIYEAQRNKDQQEAAPALPAPEAGGGEEPPGPTGSHRKPYPV